MPQENKGRRSAPPPAAAGAGVQAAPRPVPGAGVRSGVCSAVSCPVSPGRPARDPGRAIVKDGAAGATPAASPQAALPRVPERVLPSLPGPDPAPKPAPRCASEDQAPAGPAAPTRRPAPGRPGVLSAGRPLAAGPSPRAPRRRPPARARPPLTVQALLLQPGALALRHDGGARVPRPAGRGLRARQGSAGAGEPWAADETSSARCPD